MRWWPRYLLACALLIAAGSAGWAETDCAAIQAAHPRTAVRIASRLAIAGREGQGGAAPDPVGGPSQRRAGRPAAPAAAHPGGALVRGLAWSPSGDRLCLLETPPGPADEEGTGVLLDLVGRSRKEVALSGWLSPQGWSPDGKQLAFLDADGHVNVVDADRDCARRLVGFSQGALGSWSALTTGRGGRYEIPFGWSPPAWSASGTWLAFGAFYDLWVVRPDGRDLRPVTQSGWFESPTSGGMGSGGGGRRRPVTRATGATMLAGMGGGGGMRAGPPLSHPYAWSPGGTGLAYAEADAEQQDWWVQSYDPETGTAAPVRAGLLLKGIRALSWQPGGEQLAVVGVGPMAKQRISLIPRQGPIRELPTDLTSVEVLWTGDGRTLLMRGAASGTQRLTVRALAADGTIRELPPTHFLSDRDVTLVAARPGRDEIAFAIGTSVYLARADGSRWWRVQRTGRVALRGMANPLARWQRDPVVLEAVRRWRRAVPLGTADEPPADLVYGVWDDFLAHWKAPPEVGETVPYRELSQKARREVLTGLLYQSFYRSSVGADPAALTVPEWYWWLDEARLGLSRPDPSTVVLVVEGPEGANYAFVISRPEGSGRSAHRAIPWHPWWPALFAAAAVVVALLGWRQRRRERERPPEASGPRAPSGP